MSKKESEFIYTSRSPSSAKMASKIVKIRTIKQRHTSTKVSWRLRTKCIPKEEEFCGSSLTSANAMPTWVFDSREVLIARLICHDEINRLRGNDTSFKYKSQLHFPSQNKRTCTTLT